MSFKENDTVQITEQPPNQCCALLGLRGYISEVREDSLYTFTELPERGVGGSGAVPGFCMTLDSSPDLIARRDARLAEMERLYQEHLERNRKLEEGIAEIAKKYGISVAWVRGIRKDLSELEYHL